MTERTVARATEPGAVGVRYRPLYARALGLRHLHPGGMLCFVYLEGSFALSLLLALAELVSWWVVLILPASVALMVKVNDLVAGAVARSAARTPERERERLRREVSAFMPVVGRATVVTAARHEETADVADPSENPTPTENAPRSPTSGENAPTSPTSDENALRNPKPSEAPSENAPQDTAGRYAAAGRYLDAAWRQHAYAMAHHADHADQSSQRARQSASRRYE